MVFAMSIHYVSNMCWLFPDTSENAVKDLFPLSISQPKREKIRTEETAQGRRGMLYMCLSHHHKSAPALLDMIQEVPALTRTEFSRC